MNKGILISAFSFLSGMAFLSQVANETCIPTDHRYKIYGNDSAGYATITYNFYDDFSQIKHGCDLNKMSDNSQPILFGIFSVMTSFCSTETMIIAESLDFQNLNESLIVADSVRIGHLRGFSLTASPLLNLVNTTNYRPILEIRYSHINLIVNATTKVDKQMCAELLRNGVARNLSIFWTAGRLDNLNFINNCKFSQETCHLLFANSAIKALEISDLTDEYFVTNKLGFSQFDEDEDLKAILDQELNSYIKSLKITKIYRIVVDQRLLDKFVFKQTETIYLGGTLIGIEDEAFKNLRKLNVIGIFLFNMHQFFHSSANKWVVYLNYEAGQLENSTNFLNLLLSDFNTEYAYPDEDFCLFKNFPRRRSVALVVTQLSRHDVYETLSPNISQLHKSLKITCTLNYLYEITSFYSSQNVSIVNEIESYSIVDESFDPQCNLTLMLEQCFCNKSELRSPKAGLLLSELSKNEITYVLEWIEFVGPVISMPIVCFTGLVSNLIIIVILSKKGYKKDFGERMYSYMRINAIFNLLECLASVLNLMSQCISFESSIYCSTIQTYPFVIYLHIYLVGYGGETLKTCSILTMIAFSLERYIQTSKSKQALLVKFSKISYKKVNFAIIVLSAVTSFSKIFDYRTSITAYVNEAEYFPFSFYLLNNRMSNQQGLKILYLFHYFFNDLVLWLVNGLIDFCLILQIKSNLRQRERNVEHMSSQKMKTALKIKREEVNDKLNKIIVMNLIIFTICRFPELFFTCFFYFFDLRAAAGDFCFNMRLCYLTFFFIQYLYIFSYTINLYIYNRFNSNFEHNFRDFFHLKSNRKPEI